MGRCLIVSDSGHWLGFAEGLKRLFKDLVEIDVRRSTAYCKAQGGAVMDLPNVNVGDPEEADYLAQRYDTVISMHCQQIFHPYLVKNTLCVNLHPGLLPHGRGWNPYVWALNDGTAAGATLHLMDEKIDHGPIIAAQQAHKDPLDTCDTLYVRVQKAEEALITEYLPKLTTYGFKTISPIPVQPPAHTKKNYDDLCDLDLNCDLDTMTGRALIQRLQALTYEDQHNAYFRDRSGKKIHVAISLRRDV